MAKIHQNWNNFLLENIDLSGFKLNNELNAKFFDKKGLKPHIIRRLVKIAQNFYKNLKIYVPIDYITLTGSLANYNWSKYSDVDLHILIDFTQFDEVPEDRELIEDYLSARRALWNKKHKIMIKGFEVEIYIQDSSEPHVSTGVYSLMNKNWLVEPRREEFKIDNKDVEKKAKSLMDLIDRGEGILKDKKYEESYLFATKLKDKIAKFRKAGLETGGQYSAENIAFKVLRRNEYLKKLSSLVTDSYDKKMSMVEGGSAADFVREWKYHLRK